MRFLLWETKFVYFFMFFMTGENFCKATRVNMYFFQQNNRSEYCENHRSNFGLKAFFFWQVRPSLKKTDFNVVRTKNISGRIILFYN